MSALDKQLGGDHYRRLGKYQPVEVLKRWLTPEEFRGYIKGTAIVYLAREREKGQELDMQKARHTLELFEEICGKSVSPQELEEMLKPFHEFQK